MLRVIKIAIFLTDDDEFTPLVEVNEALTFHSYDVDPDSLKEKKRIDASPVAANSNMWRMVQAGTVAVRN